MWHNESMIASCLRIALAVLLLTLLADGALAMPRLERDRCIFRPPRGDKLECYTLVVAENRANPKGQEVRLKVVVLKAKRPLAPDPVIYLAGGPGDSPRYALIVSFESSPVLDGWIQRELPAPALT